MVISEAEIESRKRVNRLESALTNAIADHGEGMTYLELIAALAHTQSRWAGMALSEERKEGGE